MDFGLIDKKAIIPASSRGLGKACAWSLANEGVKIFLNGVSEESLEKTVKEFTQAGFIVDYVLGKIEDEDTRKGLLEKCPDPDILINNSGGPPPGNFYDWTESDFIDAFKSNFLSSTLFMQDVIPGMKERKFGRIVNITSAMVKNPNILLGLSTSARSGLHGISKALSRDVAKHNITINNVLPERIDTDRQTQIIEMQSKLMKVSFEEAKDSMEKQLSAGRMGTVEEFASIVCFLCSKQASYISGQNISVDGGNSSSLF